MGNGEKHDEQIPGVKAVSRISVIVPVYNVEKYLKACLDSLITQTLKPHEIILVNDGSTDRSKEICEIFAQKFKHIRLINQNNQGQASARNTGLDHASGDYIVFIDSDDFIAANMLATLYKKAVDLGVDMVKCGVWRFLDENEVNKWWGIEGNDIVLEGIRAFFRAFFDNIINSSVCNAIYKNYLFDDLRFLEGKMMEDNFIKPQLMLKSNKIAVIPDTLYYYRQRKGSIMHTFDHRHFDLIELNDHLKQTLIENDLYDLFEGDYYLWSGIHFMMTIKNATRYSSYFTYRKHVNRINDNLAREELHKIIYHLDAVQKMNINNDKKKYFANTKNTLEKFIRKPNTFWLETKYKNGKKRALKKLSCSRSP